MLGKTSDEIVLAAKLEAAGFDVTDILHSVHSNACNQASALWYLLLQKSAITNLNTPLHDNSFEINVEDADSLIEYTQKLPAFGSQNPLLQIASMSKESNNPKSKIENYSWAEESVAFNTHSPTPMKITAGRRGSRSKSESPSPLIGTMSAIPNVVPGTLAHRSSILKVSSRLKSTGITEEE